MEIRVHSYVLLLALLPSTLLYAEEPTDVSSEVKSLILRASVLESQGKLNEAQHAYSKAIEGAKSGSEIQLIARKRLIAVLLRQEPKNLEEISAQLSGVTADGQLPEEFVEVQYQVLFARVASAQTPDLAESIWLKESSALPQIQQAWNNATWDEFDVFLEKVITKDILPADTIRKFIQSKDPHAIVSDQVQSRLEVLRMRGRSVKESVDKSPVSRKVKELVLKAELERQRGHTEEATVLLKQLVAEMPGNSEIVLNARRNLLAMLLDKPSIDSELVHAQLDALIEAEGGVRGELWEFSLRTLFKDVLSGEESRRREIWDSGYRKLSGDGLVFNDAILFDLDSLIAGLQNGESLSAISVLTELLLLAPDIESIHQLQQRRTNEFVKRKEWDDAARTAYLDYLICSVTPVGPERAIGSLLEIMVARGAAPEAIEKTRLGLTIQGSVDHIDVGIAPPFLSDMPVDSVLSDLAEASLNAQKNAYSYRRQALIAAFARVDKSALESSYRGLRSTLSDDQAVIAALDDLAAVIAIVEGESFRCYRFSEWLAVSASSISTTMPAALLIENDPLLIQLRDLHTAVRTSSISSEAAPDGRAFISLERLQSCAKLAVDNHRQRQMNWVIQAFDQSRDAWAQDLAVSMINSQEPSNASATVDMLVQHLKTSRGARGADQVIDPLRAMSSKANELEHQKRFSLAIASVFFEQGMFNECLAELDAADAMADKTPTSGNLDVGFMRAISLTRLRKFEDAIALLGQMESWEGTDEQHARALFLIGWANLQTNDKQEALTSFQRVLDKYPTSQFAAKATELITQLSQIQ